MKISGDEDKFIKMIEDQLVDASNTKTDAENNITKLEENIKTVQSKILELEVEIKSMKERCDLMMFGDEDDESVESNGQWVAVQSRKRKTTEEVEKN